MQHGRIVPHCSAVLDTTLRRTPCRPASALGPAAPRCFADCCAAASSSRAPANSSPLCLADYCAAASASPRCWADRNDSLQPAPERARGPRAPCAGSRPGCGPAPPACAGARPAPGACAPAAPPSPPPAAASPACSRPGPGRRAAPRARGAAHLRCTYFRVRVGLLLTAPLTLAPLHIPSSRTTCTPLIDLVELEAATDSAGPF